MILACHKGDPIAYIRLPICHLQAALVSFQNQITKSLLTYTAPQHSKIVDDALTMLLNGLLVALLATAPIAAFAAPVASPEKLANRGDGL